MVSFEDATVVADPAFDTHRVVRILFNQPRFSDLTLLVGDKKFYSYQAVVVPASKYLEQFLQWPEDNPLEPIANEGSNRIVSVDLPDIVLPEGFHKDVDLSNTFWFEIFLKTVYGLHQLSKDNVQEVFAIAQIADFMISNTLSVACDQILSSVSFEKDKTLCVALFCEKYSLVKTLQVLKRIIAANSEEFFYGSALFQFHPEHMADIVKEATYWPLWISAFYASHQVPVSSQHWPKEL